jgi:uncharacterized protein (DUF1800 family)
MRTLTYRPIRRLPVALAILTIAGALPLNASRNTASAVPSHPDDKTIIHVLNRLGFGPRPGDVERVRALGLQTYIDQQLRPDRIADPGMSARLASFETLSKSSREIAEEYLIPGQMLRRQQQRQQVQGAAGNATGSSSQTAGEMQNPSAQSSQPEAQSPPAASLREIRTPEQMEAARAQRTVMTDLSEQKVLRAAYSERQLEEVMVDFWFNHFNVFAGKGATRGYLTEYERDAIRPRVFGKFRDLLQATAESPAMLFFLDNWQNSAPADAQTMDSRPQLMNRRPNSLRPGARRAAVFPQPPRPAQAAQNRRPRGINENYARELMELHTLGVDGGYTQKDVQEVARAFTGWTIQNPRLGGGFMFEPRLHDDGEKLILGHRIKAGGGKHDGEEVLDILAAHPSTSQFIATKLARRFVSDTPPKSLVDRAAKRFHETDGDIREVVRTIVTSPEFFSAEAYRAKVKTPFEFVVSAVRATGTETASGLPLAAALRTLGMPLYMCQPPTGYADRADAWVNTGALLARMNFAVSLTTPRFHGGRANAAAASEDPATTRDALVANVLGGDLSAETTATIAKAEQTPQAIALVLGSPEFQKR